MTVVRRPATAQAAAVQLAAPRPTRALEPLPSRIKGAAKQSVLAALVARGCAVKCCLAGHVEIVLTDEGLALHLAGLCLPPTHALDGLVFATGGPELLEVWVAGQRVVAEGRLVGARQAATAFADAMAFDRCYYPALDRLQGRPYAAMVCAGSDGHGAARQIQRIATGWRLKAVAETLIVCTRAQTPEQILRTKRIMPEDLARCEALGAALAAGLGLGIF